MVQCAALRSAPGFYAVIGCLLSINLWETSQQKFVFLKRQSSCNKGLVSLALPVTSFLPAWTKCLSFRVSLRTHHMIAMVTGSFWVVKVKLTGPDLHRHCCVLPLFQNELGNNSGSSDFALPILPRCSTCCPLHAWWWQTPMAVVRWVLRNAPSWTPDWCPGWCTSVCFLLASLQMLNRLLSRVLATGRLLAVGWHK